MKKFVSKYPVEYQIKKLFLKKKFIDAIETGTIREYSPDHLSTLRISNSLYINGHLISVDNHQPFIDFSKKICDGVNNVDWVCMDALTFLESCGDNSFDFLLIDTYNEKEYVYSQFIQSLRIIRSDGVIMIDDAGLTENQKAHQPEAEKGHLIAEYLDLNLWPYTLHGNMMIVNREDIG